MNITLWRLDFTFDMYDFWHVKFSANRCNSDWVIAIKVNFKMAAGGDLNFARNKVCLQIWFQSVILRPWQNFLQIHAIDGWVIAANVNFTFAGAAILDFVACKFWRQNNIQDLMFTLYVKYGANMCNSGRAIVVKVKFQNGGRRRLGFYHRHHE